MAGLPANRQEHYTWDDYLKLPDEGRYEIIDGVLYDMSAAPNLRHQEVSANLTAIFHAFFKGKPCRIYAAPTDVKLSDDTVVQPDLLVVCDKTKLQGTHVEGEPDLAIEILSPSSIKHDRIRKLFRYARAGVKEFWLVDPAGLAELYQLDGNTYRLLGGYEPDGTLKSALFPDLIVKLSDIFGEDVEKDVIRERTEQYFARQEAGAK